MSTTPAIPRDIVWETALQADYEGTKELIAACPEVFTDDSIWSAKCRPNFYVTTWSGEENYLVQEKTAAGQQFVLFIKFYDWANTMPKLYEDHKFLVEFSKYISDDAEFPYQITKFAPQQQYIVVDSGSESNHRLHVMDQYSSKDEAIAAIKAHYSLNYEDSNNYGEYAIINLADVRPYFVNEEPQSTRMPDCKVGTFYSYAEVAAL